jgi:hypothetical protein
MPAHLGTLVADQFPLIPRAIRAMSATCSTSHGARLNTSTSWPPGCSSRSPRRSISSPTGRLPQRQLAAALRHDPLVQHTEPALLARTAPIPPPPQQRRPARRRVAVSAASMNAITVASLATCRPCRTGPHDPSPRRAPHRPGHGRPPPAEQLDALGRDPLVEPHVTATDERVVTFAQPPVEPRGQRSDRRIPRTPSTEHHRRHLLCGRDEFLGDRIDVGRGRRNHEAVHLRRELHQRLRLATKPVDCAHQVPARPRPSAGPGTESA